MASTPDWSDLCAFPGCPGAADVRLPVLLEHPYDRGPEERVIEVCSDHAAAISVTTERALHLTEAHR